MITNYFVGKEKGASTYYEAPIMNFARLIYELKMNDIKNLVANLSYEYKHEESGLDFVKFPVDLGIVGYRVCFTNPKTKELLKKVNSLKELKKFTHGQGRGWSDVEILRANNFKVEEINGYENLFQMVANERFDLFCRGANEFLNEYKKYKYIKNLIYDDTFSIVYSLPRFFYTNKKNKKLIERIQKGLIMAYKEGSLIKLWKKEYLESVKFVNLDKRMLFWIENPNLKHLNIDYKKYFYDPLKESN